MAGRMQVDEDRMVCGTCRFHAASSECRLGLARAIAGGADVFTGCTRWQPGAGAELRAPNAEALALFRALGAADIAGAFRLARALRLAVDKVDAALTEWQEQAELQRQASASREGAC